MGYTGHYISDTDIDNWPSGTTDAEMERAITVAEAKVEAAAGLAFYAKAFDLRLNGNGLNRIFLPIRERILSVSRLEVGGEEVDSGLWSFDASSLFLNVESGGGDPEYEYLMKVAGEGALFPRGDNNVRIIGSCGSATVHPLVKEAARILVRFGNDSSLYTSLLPGGETIGDYSYNVSLTGDVAGKTFYRTGIKEADDLLRLLPKGKPRMRAI